MNGPDDFIAAHAGEALLTVIDNAEAYDRPVITLRSGECPEAVDMAEEILVAHAERFESFSGRVRSSG